MAVFPSDSVRTKNWGTEILTDADLEAQLDLLHAYFTAALNSSTGHTHDGTSNQGPKLTVLGTVAATAAINYKKGADIASAGTTDIGAATGNCLDVTGIVTITALGTVQAGTIRFVRFTGALILTHNGTSLILPAGANITTVAADSAIFLSLGSGNWRMENYFRKDGTALVGGAPSGSSIQTVNVMNGTLASGATQIPIDNTIPQNTEGDQYMTLAITPSNASNKLKIDVVFCFDLGSAGRLIAALFQDTTANALGAAIMFNNGTEGRTVSFTHYMTAGTSSSTTFKVRAGAQGATTYFNGYNTAAVLGGIISSSITITEIKA